MRRKVKSASVFSLVATLGVTLLGTDGSSAMAEATVAMPEAAAATTLETLAATDSNSVKSANAGSTKTFISQPVVQPLPVVEPAVAGTPRAGASLAELVADEPVPGKLDEQLRCLAGAIYFESKGEPLAGQLAVGRVIVARAESGRFPSSYCGVVYQRSQFSFVRGGKMPSINTSSNAWQKAKKLAMIAHEGAWESAAEGALFFHARYVSPRWKNRMTRLAQIDNHIFYR
ncbi:cell wall hydrolase [Croceicoccus ponticola]|uniref:Cell wall hydrolase n=2 Tax=Croceicoccus ponticola TaxID=2217664 RepID=A0A437GYL2_9SPHN|nr:cell wall hydrolase [Croceicoccus ponticola]RVQ67739.1 cell wall hydrolase [Croceicoccus ponticola]